MLNRAAAAHRARCFAITTLDSELSCNMQARAYRVNSATAY
jgi:hypothetical protein